MIDLNDRISPFIFFNYSKVVYHIKNYLYVSKKKSTLVIKHSSLSFLISYQTALKKIKKLQ